MLLESTLQNLERNSFNLFSVDEVGIAAMNLGTNKSVGVALIPGEVFIHAPSFLLLWVTKYLNSASSHLYLPFALTDILVQPVVKFNLKSPTGSCDYRPFVIENSFSKLMGDLLQKREGYV